MKYLCTIVNIVTKNKISGEIYIAYKQVKTTIEYNKNVCVN